MVENSKICYGCEACVNICPQNAIEFCSDEEGFFYPKINYEKCVNCRLCEKTCPINCVSNQSISHDIEGYFLRSRDNEELMGSASGGLASVIYKYALKKGMYICGVTYESDYKSAYFMVTDEIELVNSFKGSKYIQAQKRDVYNLTKKYLIENNKIVFIGLPCECAALKYYLETCKVNCKNLFLIELICHGVTSEKILRDYLEGLEKKNNSRVSYFNMRNKDINNKEGDWNIKKIKVLFKNRKKHIEMLLKSDFGFGFNNLARKSCYNCQFKGDKRVADITIGDGFGVKNESMVYSKNGVSACIINTDKGKALFDGLQELIKETVNVDLIKEYNPAINKPLSEYEKRITMGNDYQKIGLHSLVMKYRSPKMKILVKLPDKMFVWVMMFNEKIRGRKK